MARSSKSAVVSPCEPKHRVSPGSQTSHTSDSLNQRRPSTEQRLTHQDWTAFNLLCFFGARSCANTPPTTQPLPGQGRYGTVHVQKKWNLPLGGVRRTAKGFIAAGSALAPRAGNAWFRTAPREEEICWLVWPKAALKGRTVPFPCCHM